jgi:two-component system, chemotaxis family, CheB/CheR fusion protein
MRNNPFHIAAIGASAGGLQAIVEFFTHVKEDFTVSYVVILHSSREHKSELRQIISRNTPLDVFEITDGLELQANKIYIAPQSMNVSLRSGIFKLSARESGELVNRTIDHFFKSLSDELGENAIAVVLSGTGKDGSVGFGEIERKNGTTITQSPETAQFDGMPMSTILFRKPKFVVPPKEMGSVIKQILIRRQYI